MKTKKVITFLSLIIGMFVSCFAFTACSSDDDNNDPSNPLVGTWYTESVEKGVNTLTEITYKADFSCTWREYNSDNMTLNEASRGQYDVEGNRLIIWWDDNGGRPWSCTFSIKGNKMTTSEGGGTVWTKK